MNNIIYFVGIDGSGKTSLSKNIKKYFLKENKKVLSFYGRHYPFLLYPFKKFGRMTILSKEKEFIDYRNYKQHKTSFFIRYKWIGYTYGAVWMLDYILITILRIFPLIFTDKLIIIDRYYLDVIVNISETLGLKNATMLKLAKIISVLFPTPKKIFYIDIPAHIAFKRKNDIQSLQYLEERIIRYSYLSSNFSFMIIDGTFDEETVKNTVLFQIQYEN